MYQELHADHADFKIKCARYLFERGEVQQGDEASGSRVGETE